MEKQVEDTMKKKETKIKITLDTSVEDVLSLDQDDIKLIFDSTPGKFLKLPEDVLEKLSLQNKRAYFLSEESNRLEIESEKEPPTENLKVRAALATASKRLEVIFKSPEHERIFRKKWHLVWKRPDETPSCLSAGYSYVTPEDGITTFGNQGGKSSHVVGIAGQEELWLLKCPLDLHMAMVREVERLSKERDGIVEDAGAAAIDECAVKSSGQPYEGGGSFRPRKVDGRKWS